MASKEKLVERGKQLYQHFVDNVGKKNYEKKLKENPEEYDKSYNSPKKIKQLIEQAEENKANVYKDYTIPMKYKNKTLNEYLKNNIKDKVDNNMNQNVNGLSAPFYKRMKLSNGKAIGGLPIIRLLKPTLEDPIAINRYTIGHELGHAKHLYNQGNLLKQADSLDKQNKKEQMQKLVNKYHIMRNKYNKVDKEGSYYKEELADKNVPKFLKQIKVPKKDRQAIYYMKKNLYPSLYGRYQSKYGNLKYLKDYIFGFSRPLSPERKDMMRDYFYGLFYLNFSEQGIEKYKEYLDDRIKGLKDWLIEQDPACFKEQKHLDEGTPERIYWHYGQLMTLIDLRKGLDSPHSKISQIGH